MVPRPKFGERIVESPHAPEGEVRHVYHVQLGCFASFPAYGLLGTCMCVTHLIVSRIRNHPGKSKNTVEQNVTKGRELLTLAFE